MTKRKNSPAQKKRQLKELPLVKKVSRKKQEKAIGGFNSEKGFQPKFPGG